MAFINQSISNRTLKQGMRERVFRKGADFFGVGRGNAKMAKLALQQIEAAFAASRDGGDVPSASIFESQLPEARALA